MNDQRRVIYDQRRELMHDTNVADFVEEIRQEVIDDLVYKHIPERLILLIGIFRDYKEEMRRIF